MNRRTFLQRLALTLAAGPALTLLGSTATPASAAPPMPTPAPQPQDEIPHRMAYLSQPRKDMGTAIAGSTVLFYGGYTSGRPLATVDLFDGEAGTWSTAALSEPRAHPETIVVGDLLLVAGGADRSGPASRAVDIFDHRTGEWSAGWLSQPFDGGNIVAPKYAVVGRRALIVHKDVVDIFDADTGEWSAQPLSEPRTDAGIVTVGQRALIGGGIVDNHQASDAVDIYDASSDTWDVAQLAVARARPSAGAAGSTALFAGGFTPEKQRELPRGFASSDFDLYDAGTGRWESGQLTGAPDHPIEVDGYYNYATRGYNGIIVAIGDRPGLDWYVPATGRWYSLPLPDRWKPQATRLVGSKLVTILMSGAGDAALCLFDTRTHAISVAPLFPEPGPARPFTDDFDWLALVPPEPRRSYGWVRAVGTRYLMGGGSYSVPAQPPSYGRDYAGPGTGIDIYDTQANAWSQLEADGKPLGASGGLIGTTVVAVNASELVSLDVDTGATIAFPFEHRMSSQAVTTASRFAVVAGGLASGPPPPPSDNSWHAPRSTTSEYWTEVSGDAYVLDTSTGDWSRSALSAARRDIVTAKVGSLTLFIGGYDFQGGASDVVDLYDTRTGAWQTERLPQRLTGKQLQKLPLGTRGVALLAETQPKEDTFGYPGLVPTHLSIYDDGRKRWWNAPLSVPRLGATLGSVGSLVLAIGGRDPESLEPLDAVDLYDLDTGTSSVAHLTEPRGRPIVATVGTRLMIVDRYGSTLVDVYDADTGAWSTSALAEPLGPPVSDLYAQPSAATAGNVVVFASAAQREWQDRKIPFAIFDAAANTWSADHHELLYPRGPIVVGKQILYVVNGGNAGSDGFEVYDTESRTWKYGSAGFPFDLDTTDLVAVLDDRWAVFGYGSSYSGTKLFVYDTVTAGTRTDYRPDLAARGFGSVVIRPSPVTQWGGGMDRPHEAPIVAVDLATGVQRTLDPVVPREQAVIVQAGGRVLVAGGIPSRSSQGASALVDIFDVQGPPSASMP